MVASDATYQSLSMETAGASASSSWSAPPSLPTAEDIALASARDSTKRETSRASEVEAVRARVAATRLKALQSASNQLTPRVPARPKTPKEIAIARCGNVSALISSDSDSDVGDQDDQAGG